MPQDSASRKAFPLFLNFFLGVLTGFPLLLLTGSRGLKQVLNFPFLCCALLLFAGVFLAGGLLADRFSKRRILIFCKTLVCVILTAALFLQHKGDIQEVQLLLFVLLTTGNALFVPAFFGIIPELFRTEELSAANSKAGFAAFAAFTCSILLILLTGDVSLLLNALLIPAVLDLFCAFRIPAETVKNAHRLPLRLRLILGFRETIQTPGVCSAALGDGCFLSVGLLLELLLFRIVTEYDVHTIAAMLVCLPLGTAFGCLLSGKLSGRKVELGLLPVAALGVALFIPLAGFLSGPGVGIMQVKIFPSAMFWLFLTGICGGVFLVQLWAYFQKKIHASVRGTAIALKYLMGLLPFLILAFLTLVILICTASSSYSPRYAAAVLSAATLIITLFCMYILPEFALRFLIIATVNTFYRTRIYGAENLPEKGGALLVSNHVSYIDSVLISSCTSRHVRFLMQDHYYKNRWIALLARLTGFIRVPSFGNRRKMEKMFTEIQNALRNGEIVCIFPEGERTKNGITGPFKEGFRKMLPPEMEIPVIPVCISNFWGSIFSGYTSRLRLHRLGRLLSSPRVSFGKPLNADASAFQLRQNIQELAAESLMARDHGERPLHYIVLRNAAKAPFRTVMQDHGGGKRNYLRLAAEALLLSRELRKILSPEEQHIGILLPGSCGEAIAILGCLYADKVPAPLNPTTAPEVLKASLDRAGIRHILTSRAYLEKYHIPEQEGMFFMEDFLSGLPMFRRLAVSLLILLAPKKKLASRLSPGSSENIQNSGILLFSSGSTGIPKGVPLTHHNMYTNVTAFANALGIHPAKDHIVGNLPLFHSFGMHVGFWMPLLCGCKVTYTASPLDAASVCELLKDGKPTILFATPSFLQTYLRRCTAQHLRSLRLVITGAEKLRDSIRDRFQALNAALEIVEAYGCTELSPIVSVNLSSDIRKLGSKTGKKNSIGPSLNNVYSIVADPETLAPLPPEREGLLLVKGPNVMKGYLNDPERTNEVMHNGFYNTGDMAKMDTAGYITLCGRLSRFSKIAGEMVPHEMAERIINEIAGTEAQCAVVCGVPDPVKGEALAVFYTPEMPCSPAEIVEQLKQRNVSNLWIPKLTHFQPIEKIPVLGSGKLDLATIRTLAKERFSGSVLR